MERVRLMVWCRTCLSGVHLPAFAAAEGGLFADQGIEVEFVDLMQAPDFSLQGFAMRPKSVAAGRADFALTSVAYLLAAQTATAGRLPIRFAATSHQRNPLCAIVRADCDAGTPAALAGRRAARWRMPWFTDDYVGALEHMGFGPPAVIDICDDLDGALGRGEIDVIPTWADMTFHHRDAGFPIRAIPLDVDVYTTGLVAADRLAPELISKVRDAFVAGYDLQLAQPDLGIRGFRRRYPDVSEEHIRGSWARFEPYAFDRVPPGTMDADRWEQTISYTAKAHGLSVFPGERLYRPELLTPPREPSPAVGERPLARVYELRGRLGTGLPG
ncbi:MAG: ABC transporter substrate-binding protein [Actinomycetota bacterium]|nr:ABC transporter substrate-binding protein [Actinomycetota bacterium]